ncbi:MAG: DUF6457 domain-containing protein [Actinomycetota bacterium]|nr:DUF6457 domain-containing protein [Actinomycetota bacterium]
MSDVVDEWIAALAAELGVDAALIDRDLILDVARDAAHAVARPAAPLATFLVGLAAGLAGTGPEGVREMALRAQRLAAARQQAPGQLQSQQTRSAPE